MIKLKNEINKSATMRELRKEAEKGYEHSWQPELQVEAFMKGAEALLNLLHLPRVSVALPPEFGWQCEKCKEVYEPDESGSAVCPYCNGDGWTAEHDLHPHPDGDCMGMCPVQVQCQYCEATGKVTQEVLDKYNENIKVSNESDLPF